MPTPAEPRQGIEPNDPEFDATDGGWDPYVTSLMLGPVAPPSGQDDEDDGVPVMSFSGSKRKK